jgi:hypothetical protein
MDKKEEMPILLGLAAEWNRSELSREVEESTRTWSRRLDPRMLALDWKQLAPIRPGEDSPGGRDLADSLITQHLLLDEGEAGVQARISGTKWLSWLKRKRRARLRKREGKNCEAVN